MKKGALTCNNCCCETPITCKARSTFLVKNSTVFYPQIQATADGSEIITHGGTVLAARTAEIFGLAAARRTHSRRGVNPSRRTIRRRSCWT